MGERVGREESKKRGERGSEIDSISYQQLFTMYLEYLAVLSQALQFEVVVLGGYGGTA